MHALIRFFASRVTVAYAFTALIILLGLGALTVIQRDNFPSVDFNEMTITTRYPGASPEDVELNVTNQIEEELEEVDGLKWVVSFSMENVSIVHVRIDPDVTDARKVKNDVRDAASRVGDLPPEVDERPVVEELNTTTAFPIIEVGLTGDGSYRLLRDLARRTERALLGLPGVARVEKFGYLDREIKIEVSQDALEKWRVPAHAVAEAVSNRNIRASGGSFESYTSERNIVTLAQFEDPLDVSDVIVRVTESGTQLRVSDFARLLDAFEPQKVVSRMNGKQAISLLVYKKESADMIRTVNAIKQLVEDNKHRLSDGVQIEYSNDASRQVRNRLSVVATNGAFGLVLVLFVLALFLDFRSAFWVAMGIPVVLLGTLFLLPVFGAYLDSIALAAMILVIGIVVDDGIVIAESIWRHRELGLSPMDAAVEGTVVVYLPVLTTVLTTGLAFAPMFFMSGVFGDFVFVIPLVVCLALAISLLETTIALPAHLIGSRRVPSRRAATSRHATWFTGVREGFDWTLSLFLRLRYIVISGFLALLISAFWYAGKYLDFVLFPTQSADNFFVLVELPSGSSLAATEDLVIELEEVLRSLPEGELASYVSRIGSHGEWNLGENENWAYLGVYLTPFATRERNADQIVEWLRERMARVEGVDRLRFVIDDGGPPVGRPITIRVVGSNDEQRDSLASLILERLERIDGVKDLDRDDKAGKDQIVIDLDYVRLANAGLSVADVARNVRLAFDGEVVTSVRYGDEDVEFRVILEPRARHAQDDLQELLVTNQEGRFIRLGDVARFRIASGPSNFYHYDFERTITVTGDVDLSRTTPLKATTEALAELDLDRDWPDMRLVVGGEAEETTASMQSLLIAFVAAALGIYLLLLLLFNSVFQPLLVILAIPFGLIGVIAAFALHQEPLGFLAMLGVVGLTGIVVNDSLILVNEVNHLRESRPEKPFAWAVVEAAKVRLRPVVLTSVTTVAGLLPMAYGLGGSDPFAAPMALAMGYGILFATPLTLILLPCLLHVQEDLSRLVHRALGQRHTGDSAL
ncbi:MAG: efflux RND transporter permease subunit [Thiohalocapsa sp. PB-PSB1]|jgi:multidrug efflux pump subunit AcrB|nr:MAG: efflux RND transporter permease subunit [Thiohalocapsa sp. PB-PSB1]HCS88642.1 AcrB/AcrD/AcrF family protein [Chromatiaceae bacterium]